MLRACPPWTLRDGQLVDLPPTSRACAGNLAKPAQHRSRCHEPLARVRRPGSVHVEVDLTASERGLKMATKVEERVSRLEGGYEHLATKADLAALETRLTRLVLSALGILAGAAVAAAAYL